MTLDISGSPDEDDSPEDSPDQPQSPSAEEEDASKFLADLGFGGAMVGDMAGYAMVGAGPGEETSTYGAPATLFELIFALCAWLQCSQDADCCVLARKLAIAP